MSSSQAGTPPIPTTPLPEEFDQERTDPGVPQCRICFLTSAEAPELAPLISPCECKGSMKHVHSGCINKWRGTSRAREDFWTCSHCQSPYRFAKRWTLPISMALNPAGRSLFAVIAYIGFALILSEIVAMILSSTPKSWLLNVLSTCLRVGVESFVWGNKKDAVADWKVVFALNDPSGVVARRFLVGVALIGVLESFIRAPFLSALVYALAARHRGDFEGFLANSARSFTFIYVAWGITASVFRLININSRLAWMIYYRAVREVVDKDDERVGPVPRP